MAELADALDSGSSGHYARAGSSPVIRIKWCEATASHHFLYKEIYWNRKGRNSSYAVAIQNIWLDGWEEDDWSR